MSHELSSVQFAQMRPDADYQKTADRPVRKYAAQQSDTVEARRNRFVDAVAKANGLERGRLVIEKDEESGRFVHKLIDPTTGNVVRQWPDDQWLEFARTIGGAAGLLVDRRV